MNIYEACIYMLATQKLLHPSYNAPVIDPLCRWRYLTLMPKDFYGRAEASPPAGVVCRMDETFRG